MIESDENGKAVIDADSQNLYTEQVYTVCTAESVADQQVSDGGLHSL